MSELTVLQAVRFKGRVSVADLAATVGEDPADVSATVEQLRQSGWLADDEVLRISRAGRARLAELLASERACADMAALTAAYNDFRSVNAEFKALVTDWQLKDGQPNAMTTPTTTRVSWPVSRVCINGSRRSSRRPLPSYHG